MFKYGVENPKDMFGTEIMGERWKELVLPKCPSFYDYSWGIMPGYFLNGGEKTLNIMWNHLEVSPRMLDVVMETSKDTDAYVFVSHWQYFQYLQSLQPLRLSIERKSFVIKNAIDPITSINKPSTDILNIVYHSDPSRGLDVLLKSLKHLYRHKDIRIHIFRDMNSVKDTIPNDPRLVFHGRVSNAKVKEELSKMHIFVYPSTYPETSCISLLEAMSAGCYCVHSNVAALPETSMHLTHMYEYNDNKDEHAARFAYEVEKAIFAVRNGWDYSFQKSVVDKNFSWETRVKDWVEFSRKAEILLEDKRKRFALYY